jgi:ubiquinone/menaquinone biosynthesis C-methylase UbiE
MIPLMREQCDGLNSRHSSAYAHSPSMVCKPPYFKFYVRIIKSLISRNIVDPTMSVLVVCGGVADKRLFQELGFTDVTISNLDSRMTGKEFEPYKWSYQDAERLTFPDNSFDLVVVCAGLHHCYSPHRALLECYRVAKQCAVALEARDGFLSRIAVRLGVVDEYEVTAVVGNKLLFGGVANTPIPNYIYRWTKREVTKTIASYAPYTPPRALWFHEFEPPIVVLRQRKTVKGLLVMYAAYPILWILTKVFPSQCNLFAFAVLKPDLSQKVFPWIKVQAGRPLINREWVEKHFKPTDASSG